MGNKYDIKNSGQILSVGDKNIVKDNSITQNVGNKNLDGVDIKSLKEELNKLKDELKRADLLQEATEVKNAIEENEDSKILRFLKNAGKKALQIAEVSGIPIAVEVIKKSLGV